MRPSPFTAIVFLSLATTVVALAVGTMESTEAVPTDVQAGKTLYTQICKKCHAADGRGVPAVAKVLKVTFKPMESEEIQKKTDTEIREIITNGRGKMKPLKDLSADQIENIIAYLRTFGPK